MSESVAVTWDRIHSSNEEREHPLAEQVHPSRVMQTFVDFHVVNYLTEKRIYRFLDVGCGTGANLKAITECQQIEVHGLDVAKSAIERCQLRHPRGQFSCADSKSMPYPDEYFDFVYAEGSLYYVSELEDFSRSMEEIYRVLKPNGVCRVYTKSIDDKAVPLEFKGEPYYKGKAMSGWEGDLPILYISKGLLQGVLAKFSDVKMGCDKFNFIDSESGMHAFWVVTAMK